MERADRLHIPEWLWFTLALVSGVGAAFAFIVYAANGMVIGDLIGLLGREHDIAIAQHRSQVGLWSGIVLQLGAAGTLFAGFSREDDRAKSIVRALLGSLVATLISGMVLLRILH